MRNNKFWIIPLIILISTLTVTGLIYIGIRNVTLEYMNYEEEIPEEYEDADNCEPLFLDIIIEDETTGKYYTFAACGNDMIVFVSDVETTELKFSHGSYYPNNYWNDEYTQENLVSLYLNHKHYLAKSDESGENFCTDISDFEENLSYYEEGSKGYLEGSSIIETLEKLENVKVYNYEDTFVGYTTPNAKNFRALSGVAVIAIAFVVAICIAVVGIIASITVFIILLVRRNKRRAAEAAEKGTNA